jgi:hypothetical protein
VVTDETALLKRILKIPDNHEIAFEVRLGWPSRDHASSPAGRSLQDAVHWNRYH